MNKYSNMALIYARARNEALEEAALAILNDYEEREEDEDFNPYDYSGGNFDDCYWMGRSHGENDVLPVLAAAIRALKVNL